MKGLRILFAVSTYFLVLPLQLYVTYLLYTHVQASEHMWFVWIASTVLAFVVGVGGVIAQAIVDLSAKEDAKKEILEAIAKAKK